MGDEPDHSGTVLRFDVEYRAPTEPIPARRDSRMRRIGQWLATGKRSAHVLAAAEEP